MPRSKTPFDATAARHYLESKGISTANIKTEAYLKRLYRATQKAESVGRTIPTRAEARGHAPVRVQHVARDPKSHRLEHYFIERTAKMEANNQQLSHNDLSRLVNKAGKKKRSYTFIFRGLPNTGSPTYDADTWKPGDRASYRLTIDGPQVHAWLDRNPTGNVIDFANAFDKHNWIDIDSVAIAMYE